MSVEMGKRPFLEVFWTFLQRGSLEIAYIGSTCTPSLARSSGALGLDGSFRRGLVWKIVRCAFANGIEGFVDMQEVARDRTSNYRGRPHKNGNSS